MSKRTRVQATTSDSDDVDTNEINELLGVDPKQKQEEDEGEGQTVSLAELDMVMNEGSLPTTPKKARSLPSCLSEKRITSEKRIRFGNKATVDYHEGDPASVVSPLLQRVESDISTRPSAITEIDYPENLETSRDRKSVV